MIDYILNDQYNNKSFFILFSLNTKNKYHQKRANKIAIKDNLRLISGRSSFFKRLIKIIVHMIFVVNTN
jgi:hypothetical protein